jgi:hypothetical protein
MSRSGGILDLGSLDTFMDEYRSGQPPWTAYQSLPQVSMAEWQRLETVRPQPTMAPASDRERGGPDMSFLALDPRDSHCFEPIRVRRRLHSLRGWGYAKTKQVFA